jgi:hypothetical protein
VWGNGLGQSFFLEVTLSSGQVEWSPRRAIILSKFTVVSSFEEWSILEVGVGQSFPLGNGLDSHSLGQTHSIQVSLCLVLGGMAQLGEWSRFKNQGHAFPRVDSFSLGCTMISVGGMAQLGEWSRLRNQGQLFFYA